MLELDQLRSEASEGDIELATRLSGLIDRITESVGKIENHPPPSKVLVEQAREAQAVALDKATALLPSEFAGRLDAYSQATFGRAWDHDSVEKLAVNRLVSGYLVAPYVPSNVAQVLALHAATFPHHSMNVELYATIAERLAAGGSVREGVELARAGLRYCDNHTDVNLLQNRVKADLSRASRRGRCADEFRRADLAWVSVHVEHFARPAGIGRLLVHN
jgi:hypothetical protein